MSKKTYVKKLFKQYKKNKIVFGFESKDEFDQFLEILEIEGLKTIDGEPIKESQAEMYYPYIFDNYFEFEKKTLLCFAPKDVYPYYHYKIMHFSEFYLAYEFAKWKDSVESLGFSWPAVAGCN